MAICETPSEESPPAMTQQEEHEKDIHTLQRDDARLKATWSKEMGDVWEFPVYRTVSVLLISWDDEAGDLKTEEEVKIQPSLTEKRDTLHRPQVQNLRHVLEEKYNFQVDEARLKANKPAQIQLNRHLAHFVDEKHDKDGLLIVYYAGHGIPGNIPGELKLAG